MLFYFNVENSGSWTSTENKKNRTSSWRTYLGSSINDVTFLRGRSRILWTTGLTTTKALIMKSVTMGEGWKKFVWRHLWTASLLPQSCKNLPFFLLSFFHQMPIFFLLRQIQQRNWESLWLSKFFFPKWKKKTFCYLT